VFDESSSDARHAEVRTGGRVDDLSARRVSLLSEDEADDSTDQLCNEELPPSVESPNVVVRVGREELGQRGEHRNTALDVSPVAISDRRLAGRWHDLRGYDGALSRGVERYGLRVRERADVFLGLMDQAAFFTLGRAWTGVTDDEFFWEPVPHTWSVRRRDQCRTASPFGAGDWVVDFGPEPTPPPLTSIAWQAWHVGSLPMCLSETEPMGGSHPISSGWTSPYLTHHQVFTSAADASAAFHAGWDALRSALATRSDAELRDVSPDYTYAHAPMHDGLCVLGPPGLMRPGSFFVARAINEIIHHSAQICLLRDHYANRGSHAS
jgi:hypothetical protein